ncbi:MAG: hypothetical protein E7438_08350 [Ruminococcaceae bacterium]|nr:hypothetical protein [Oscillospiraceae bacterium]
MRYLSWDEVKSLDKFLVEDNDDAIGIEIHTGLYDLSAEDPYGKPETVKAYALEELAGGEFLQVGTETLRAVVSNRLYWTDSRNWVDNSGTDATYVGARREKGYDYERAVLTFRETLERLPDEEILALERFMVRDNKRVEAVRILPGYMGIGGSNTSGFSSDRERIRDYPLEYLKNSDFVWVQGYSLRALVGDVLYFCSNDKVFTLNYRERDTIFRGNGIAYDTIEATEIVLLLK